MGNCHQREEELVTNSILTNLKFEVIIGLGAFATVWRAYHKIWQTKLAVKVFNKSQIPSRDVLEVILKEKKFLSCLRHPFLINMQFAFHDKKRMYLGLELKQGGDLRFHMMKKVFNETEAKFIVACIVEALSYIHSKNVIHKDLKPENVVFDNRGYVFLTDFGTASFYNPNNSHETAGTPGYMAPEVICRQQHSYVSDYFSLGVVLFELMTGKRPYNGKNRREIREKILEKQAKVPEKLLTSNWSPESIDFCNKLLKRKPSSRIGANGAEQVRAHSWFKDINFASVSNFEVNPEFCPTGDENFCSDFTNGLQCMHSPRRAVAGTMDFFGYFYASDFVANA